MEGSLRAKKTARFVQPFRYNRGSTTCLWHTDRHRATANTALLLAWTAIMQRLHVSEKDAVSSLVFHNSVKAFVERVWKMKDRLIAYFISNIYGKNINIC